jgi:HEAT repeat protein
LRQFIQGLFDPEVRERRAFEKLALKLVSKNQQHEDRMAALEALSAIDTEEANAALFRRWDLTAEKEREDRAEKEYLATILVSKGVKMLPALRAHNGRSVNVTWPVQVMRQVCSEEEVVTEILRVLAAEGAQLATFRPEKKVTLLRLLQDQDDPRIPEAVAPFLDDFDESVRSEAALLLSYKGDEGSRDALLARLGNEEEDSARVKGAILGALAAKGWDLSEHRPALTPHLAGGWTLQKDGTLVAAQP